MTSRHLRMQSARATFTLAAFVLASCAGGDDGGGSNGEGSNGMQSPSGLDSGATVTVDGTTYEITEVLDCTIGNEGYPDDRKFVGESADGSVRFSVFYLDLGGEVIPDVDLEVPAEGSEWTWSSSYAGAARAYEIDVLERGAEGNSEVGVVGIDAPAGIFTVTWSFACDDR